MFFLIELKTKRKSLSSSNTGAARCCAYNGGACRSKAWNMPIALPLIAPVRYALAVPMWNRHAA
jgi:hypothetical protein